MNGKYFNFTRLVSKYSRAVRLHIRHKGSYKGGIYCEGNVEILEVMGAVISKKRSVLNNSGGNYAQEGKQLYMLSPIPHSLEDVMVEFEGQLYKVTADRDSGNEFFTGVCVYCLTWVQPFDRRKEN